MVDGGEAGGTEAALRRVDNSFERQIIVLADDHPEIGDGVTDFEALVKAWATDHPVGYCKGNQPFFKLAGLKAGTHQHRHFVQILAP